MSLVNLANELKRQATQTGRIALSEETVSNSGLTPTAQLNQLISDSLDLPRGALLEITLAANSIPSPAPADQSFRIAGSASFLNLNNAPVTVELVSQGAGLDFTLQAALSDWTFGASFPSLAESSFEELVSNTPTFIFSTRQIQRWSWNQNDIALTAGLNFASVVEMKDTDTARPDDALIPAVKLLKTFSPNTARNASLILSGPIDIQEGKRKNSPYPELNLRAPISADVFSIFFLNVGKPFLELKIAEVFSEGEMDYLPGLFLGLELTANGRPPLIVRAEIVKDSPCLVLSLMDDPANPLTLENTIELMAGQSFDGFIPNELKGGLSQIAFKGFAASLSLGQPMNIISAHVTLGSRQGVHFFDNFQVDRFDFIWSILGPGVSNTMMGYFTAQFQFFPAVFRGNFEIEISTDLSFTGRFNGSVSVNDLVREVFEGKLSLPSDFVSLVFSDFHLFVDVRRRNYVLEATAELSLTLGGNEKLSFKNVRFGVNIQSPPNGGSKTYSGFIGGTLSVGSLDIYVSANHPSPGQGWILEGHLPYTGSGINLTSLAADLLEPFNATLPQSVPDVTLNNIAVSFDTQTKDFNFTCDGRFQVDDKEVGAAIVIDLKHNNGNYTASFGGHLDIGRLRFDLQFARASTSTSFLATYSHAGYQQNLKVKELVNYLSRDIAAGIPDSLEIDIKDLLLAFSKDANGSTFLFGIDIGASINLSNLPLVGQMFPADQTIGVDDLQILVASKQIAQNAIQGFNQMMPTGVTQLPAADLSKGISVTAQMKFGASTQTLNLPVSDSSGTAPPASPPAQGPTAQAPSSAVVSSDNAKWFTLQKSFGPVYFQRVGVQYQSGAVWFLLDASLSMAGLKLSLDGLSVGSPLNKFEPKFNLRGLGIDYSNGPVEIGGAFLRTQVQAGGQMGGKTYDEYDGAAIIRTAQFTLSAIGSYTDLNGHPSLFIYAVLDYPLGGPAFFFVTGLAAGFGYNRSLLTPAIDQVAQFPLVAQAISGQRTPNNLATELQSLQQYIPPAVGEIFFAVGVKFTSFKIIDSFVLVTVSFGSRFELNLLGLSTLISPPQTPPGVPPLSVVQMAVKASFIPDEGFLGVQAQLTSASYIFTRDCHLTGGFAFYSWFSGVHSGDFVLTLGGYHPNFNLPSHYPRVPRVGISWQVNRNLSVKGSAYFALTASALMAGGSLEATWLDGNLKAWFNAGADFIISWKPYHYDARVYVNMGVSYTFNVDLWFTTIRKTISVDVGADLHIWGPEFSGTAHIKLWIVSFDVSFGSGASQQPQAIGWDEFRKSFIPDKDDEVCSVAVKSGLVKMTEDKKWIVNPKDFCLVTNSVIPSKSASAGSIQLQKGSTDFGVGPMGISTDSLDTSHTIEVSRIVNNVKEPASDEFVFNQILKKVPAGLWGKSLTPSLNGQAFIDSALSGFEIKPKNPPAPGHTSDIDRANLAETAREVPNAYKWEPFKPFIATLADDDARRETISAGLAQPGTISARNRLLNDLGIAGDTPPASSIAFAFTIPPQVGELSR